MQPSRRWGLPAAGASLAAALIVAIALIPVAAQAAPGDVYVVDESAFDNGPSSGAVFKLGPTGGDATPIVQGSPLQSPSGMVMNKDGNLLVADYGGSVPGAIFQVDPRTGALSTFASGPPLYFPTDLAFGPDGMLYVSDYGDPHQISRSSFGSTQLRRPQR